MVEHGKISAIYYSEQGIPSNIIPDEIIQCKDAYLIPGFIDPHVHLRGFDQEHKETPETGTKAAIAGGVTTLLAMPNTQPTLSTMNRIYNYMEKYPNIYSNVGIIGGLFSDTSESELQKMRNWGVFGLKIYPGQQSLSYPLPWPQYEYKSKSMTKLNEDEKQVWVNLFATCQKLDLPILFHPQIPIPPNDMKAEFEAQLQQSQKEPHPELMAHSNQYSEYNEYLFGEHIKSILQKAADEQQPTPQIHICHVSTPLLMEVLKDRNNKLAKIIFEVTPHHIFLNYSQSFIKSSHAKVLCPLRSPETQIKMYDLAAEAEFDIIGTDHAPHSAQEKDKPFYDAPSGFPGIELLAPLLLSEVFSKRLFLSQIVYNCSKNPAEVFGIPNKGQIEPGFDADFILVEKTAPYKIDNEMLKTKSKIGPYHGKTLNARVKKTIIGGEIVFDADTDVIRMKGTYIRKQMK